MTGMRIALHVLLVAGLALPEAAGQARPSAGQAPQSDSYLGVWIWEVDAARAKELRLPEPGGVEVTRVSPGSPADAVGMQPGDVVVEFEGQKIEDKEEFQRLVAKMPVGKTVRLRIVRNGTSQFLTPKIGYISAADRPGPISAREFSPPGRQDVPRSLMTWRNPLLGVDLEPLFGQLAAHFGVTEGVLVRSVQVGSPAERSGLKAGDAIIRVGKHPVTTPGEISARLRALTGPSTPVTVMRDRKETPLTVTLDQR